MRTCIARVLRSATVAFLLLSTCARVSHARAGANESTPCIADDVWEQLGYVKDLADTLSVQKIRSFVNGGIAQGSMFWTTNDGYALTAGHVFDDCVSDALKSGEKFPLVCPAIIDKVRPVQVLAYRSCLGSVADQRGKNPECKDNLDYALIRVIGLGNDWPRSCLHVNLQKPRVGDNVRAIGYPKATYIRSFEGNNSDGFSEFVTYGKITTGTELSCERTGGKSGMPAHDQIEHSYPLVSLLRITNEVDHGDSGGVLLNSDGDAVAILVAGVANDYAACSEAVSLATPLSVMVQSIRSQFPSVDLRAAFDCKERGSGDSSSNECATCDSKPK